MTEEELTRLFDTFERSVFRLEQLQRYLVPQEAEQLEAFKASRGVTLATAETDPWLARVAADVAAGKTWTRVRIVEHPLTDYTLYELQVYQETAVLGEWIGVADRAAGPALEQLREDFLIFDDRLIVRMRYDQEGRFLGADLAEDHALDTYRRRRDLALTHAVPLADYSRRARRPPSPPTSRHGCARSAPLPTSPANSTTSWRQRSRRRRRGSGS